MTTFMLLLGRGGAISANHVIAIANIKSTPVKRMVKSTPESHVLNLTYGYPERSVIIMDNGYLVISSRHQSEIAKAIGLSQELEHAEDPPPWW
ncbi:MAG: extracellular matrix/biofilm biosynthesis regulator RemA family protein [Patescibacteria group bacterium]